MQNSDDGYPRGRRRRLRLTVGGLPVRKAFVKAHDRLVGGRYVRVPAHYRVDHGTQPRATTTLRDGVAKTPQELEGQYGQESDRFHLRDKDDNPLLVRKFGAGKRQGFAIHDQTGAHVGTVHAVAGDKGATVRHAWTHPEHEGKQIHVPLLRRLVSHHGSVQSHTVMHRDLHAAFGSLGPDHEVSTVKEGRGVRFVAKRATPTLFKGLRVRGVRVRKSRIKGHWRVTGGGKMVWVPQHDDKRTRKPQQPGKLQQRSLFGDTAEPTPRGASNAGQPSLFDAEQPTGPRAQTTAGPSGPADPITAIGKANRYLADARLKAAVTEVHRETQSGDLGGAHAALHQALERLEELADQLGPGGYEDVHQWLEEADDHLARVQERIDAGQEERKAEPPAGEPHPQAESGAKGPTAGTDPRRDRVDVRGRKQFVDAGEKIGGSRADVAQARKRFSEDVSMAALCRLEAVDPDAARKAVTRSAIWPPPSVEEAKAAGREPGWAMLVRTTYDAIENGPREHTPEDRREYLAAVQTLQQVLTEAETGKRAAEVLDEWRQTYRRVRDYGPSATQSEYDRALYERARALGDRFCDWLSGKRKARGYTLSSYCYTAGQVWPAQDQDSLWTAVLKEWGHKDRERTAGEKEAIERWKPCAPKEYERLGDLPSIDVRDAEVMLDLFGFRGVEFGNWMDDESSRVHVNRCAEALVDLAAVLDLDPRDVSINGRLALAFGARGTGTALAHYEPGKVVINLTKLGGAGTLAHEWWHFLDDTLARLHREDGVKDKLSATDPKVLERSASPVLRAMAKVQSAMLQGDGRETIAGDPKVGGGSWYPLDSALRRTGNNPQAALDAVLKEYPSYASDPRKRKTLKKMVSYLCRKCGVEALTVATGRSAFLVDAQARGKYWALPHEMAARAFEAFIHERLRERGRGNNYLVYDRNLGPRRPYPQGDERSRINEGFAELIAAVHDERVMQKALRVYARVHEGPFASIARGIRRLLGGRRSGQC